MSTKTNKDLFDKCRAYKRHKVAQEYGVYPFFRPLDDSEGSRVLIEGKPRIMLGSNNYLGLTHHPEVIAAAKDALELGLRIEVNRLSHLGPELGVVLRGFRKGEVVDINCQQQLSLGEEVTTWELGDGLPSGFLNDSLKMLFPVGPGLWVAVKGFDKKHHGLRVLSPPGVRPELRRKL